MSGFAPPQTPTNPAPVQWTGRVPEPPTDREVGLGRVIETLAAAIQAHHLGEHRPFATHIERARLVLDGMGYRRTLI